MKDEIEKKRVNPQQALFKLNVGNTGLYAKNILNVYITQVFIIKYVTTGL